MNRTEIADKIVFTLKEIAELHDKKSKSADGYNEEIKKKGALVKKLVDGYDSGQMDAFEGDE